MKKQLHSINTLELTSVQWHDRLDALMNDPTMRLVNVAPFLIEGRTYFYAFFEVTIP